MPLPDSSSLSGSQPRPSRLPRTLTLVGIACVVLGFVAVFAEEWLSFGSTMTWWFRYVSDVTGVLFFVYILGMPITFVGAILWARQLEPRTRFSVALALLVGGFAILLSPLNIHGWTALLLPVMIISWTLSVVLGLWGLW